MRRFFSSGRRSAPEQQKLEATLRELSDNWITFNHTLGLRVESLSPPALRFDFRKALVGHYGHNRLHGGVISSALDAMGGFALMCAIAEKHAAETTEQILGRFERMGTIDLRIDFLRQGKGEHFRATANVLRLGGRVGSTHMQLVNDEGLLIATGSAAYMIS